jgi:hypothetical protein
VTPTWDSQSPWENNRRSQVSPLPAPPGRVFRNRAVQLDAPSLPPMPAKLAIVIGDGLTGCAPEVAAACDLHVRTTSRSTHLLSAFIQPVSVTAVAELIRRRSRLRRL